MPDIHVFKPTLGDWYPSYKVSRDDRQPSDKLVRVSLLKLKDSTYKFNFRVCVWGLDDFGMEVDCREWSGAFNTFTAVISQPTVEVEWLKRMGFKYA